MPAEYTSQGGLLLTDDALSRCYKNLSELGLTQCLGNALEGLVFENPLLEITLRASAQAIESANRPLIGDGAAALNPAVRMGGQIAYYGLQIATNYAVPVVQEPQIEAGFRRMDLVPPPKDKLWEDLVTETHRNTHELIGTILLQSRLGQLEKFMHTGAGCVLFFVGIQAGVDAQRRNAQLS